ncbi:hypothetical protein IAD21_04835 [Abditibacteriota bacterium]|nr:hypothetical protein IAD21_04835 [Abditibacteriota bacterium]
MDEKSIVSASASIKQRNPDIQRHMRGGDTLVSLMGHIPKHTTYLCNRVLSLNRTILCS